MTRGEAYGNIKNSLVRKYQNRRMLTDADMEDVTPPKEPNVFKLFKEVTEKNIVALSNAYKKLPLPASGNQGFKQWNQKVVKKLKQKG